MWRVVQSEHLNIYYALSNIETGNIQGCSVLFILGNSFYLRNEMFRLGLEVTLNPTHSYRLESKHLSLRRFVPLGLVFIYKPQHRLITITYSSLHWYYYNNLLKLFMRIAIVGSRESLKACRSYSAWKLMAACQVGGHELSKRL